MANEVDELLRNIERAQAEYARPSGAVYLSEAMMLLRESWDAIRALRKDRDRLDWLKKQSDPSWSLFSSASWQYEPELREAIDAAMAAESARSDAA